MPQVSNPGSRAALVTWTVVTSILAVTATIMAIYFYVDADRVHKERETAVKQLTDVVDPAMIRNEADKLNKLKDARLNPAWGVEANAKLLYVALAQRDALSKLVGGADETAALAAAAEATKKAKDAGAAVVGASLTGAVDALIAQVNALKTESANNKKDSDESKAKLQATLANTSAQIQQMTSQMEAFQNERGTAVQQLQSGTEAQRNSFEQTAGELRKQLEAANAQIDKLNNDNADLGKKLANQGKQLESVLGRLNEIRIDPNRAVTQQPDGKLIRVPGDGTCYIDLGSGDQITAGMTFEVYDKIRGVPPPGDPSNDQNLPRGKASIEVLEPGSAGSKCRIINITPGQALSEGDLIVNLVYDRNTKYKFVVYGNFDMDRNGVATPQDAEVIKRLITGWGGEVVNDINVDTDFVILGKEPVVPEKPKDDDAIAMAKYLQAVADYDAYADMSSKARSFRLPILNQNRFLYFVGYFEEAKR